MTEIKHAVVILFLTIVSFFACSRAEDADKLKLVGEWGYNVYCSTNGDYIIFNDQYSSYYMGGVLILESTNTSYVTMMLNNNNSYEDRTYQTNGTYDKVKGTWSVNSAAKYFTVTLRYITNITISTDIEASFSRKVYYRIDDDNNFTMTEMDYTTVYSMIANVRTNYISNVTRVLAQSGISYMSFRKK